MWRHFFRQLFGLPVGGRFTDIQIGLIEHGTFRIRLANRSTRVGIHTEVIASRRVSTIITKTLSTWDDGAPIIASERLYLLDAATYWLETQGNVVRSVE